MWWFWLAKRGVRERGNAMISNAKGCMLDKLLICRLQRNGHAICRKLVRAQNW